MKPKHHHKFCSWEYYFAPGDKTADAWGEAIDQAFEDPHGRLWVTNGEYASMVIYCPYCGAPAKNTTPPP